MTKKEAIRILITAGVRDMSGQGMGIRQTTDERRDLVKQAIKKVWPMVHDREMTPADEQNLRSHWN